MSEQDKIKTPEDEVEAHKRRPNVNEEPKAEGEGEDDVEAHKKKSVQ